MHTHIQSFKKAHACTQERFSDLLGAEVVVCTLRGTLRVTNVRAKTKSQPLVKHALQTDCDTHIHQQLHTYKHVFSHTHTCLTPMALSLLALTHLHYICWPQMVL